MKRCQEEAFADDLELLRAGKDVDLNSRLRPFTPTLDGNGLIRIGGRLRRAKIPYDNKHPVLLPGKHPLSVRIAEAFHHQSQHAGMEYVLATIRQHFWILAGRETVRQVKDKCLRCRRYFSRPLQQRMGDLPDARLAAEQPPFTCTAVDYFGPFDIGYGRGRTIKRWGVLFTCLTTRAVYLDVAASLSADDFLLTFRRFIGIYTRPQHMYSDNGTCFIGAERELREAVDALHASETAQEFMRAHRIKWSFQPARSPHFGGAHEALVKSTKRALYSALEQEQLSHRHPTDDIFRTLLFEIAGLLNARPQTAVSADPADLRPLTPNDCLNRPPTSDRPAGDFSTALPNEHYHYVQRLVALFWDRWKRGYLQSLSARSKWRTQKRNLAVGDLVLEIDKNARRGQWNVGRVVGVCPGEDGLVRAVDVLLPTGVFRRGTTELCLLEADSTASPVPSDSSVSGEHVAEKTIEPK